MSKTSISNQALVALGANTIVSIDADTTEAKICKLYYDDILDSMLDMASWSFATKQKELPPSADGNVPKPFTHQFLIPKDVIRILEASEDPDFTQQNPTYWQINGKYIVANSAKLFIRYIERVTDTAAFTPSFTQAFVARLAAEIAPAITQSASTADRFMKKAGSLIQIAAAIDGTQGRSRKLRSPKYLNVRRGNGGNYFSVN